MFGNLFAARRSVARARRRSLSARHLRCGTLKERRLRIEDLEARQLLSISAGIDEHQCHAQEYHPPVGPPSLQTHSQTHVIKGVPYEFAWDSAPAQAAGITEPLAAASAALHPLDSIPILNSNPGATASLYLDFNGHFEPVWGSYTNITTPAYDIDGDPTTFSDLELANIQAVWETVSEDYAPFNINVTTVEPAVLAPGMPIAAANGVALRVAIGAQVDNWAGGDSYAGLSYINSFTNSIANVAYDLAKPTWAPSAVAMVASHEAGHSFGLQHQSSLGSFSAPGWHPLMYGAVFNTTDPWIWYNGTTTGGAVQDDMAVLANSTNGFGYRSDDHGDTIASATALAQVGNTWSGAGIIGTNSDVDVFSFTVASQDTYRMAANVAAVGPNLDSVLELRNSAGQLVACANPQKTQNAEIVKNLAPGDYYLSVMSTGVYGWIGQYTVSIDDALPPGISVTTTSRTMVTGEDGRQASFAVELQTQPAADVTVAVSSSDTTEGTVSPPSLTFTPANWNVSQTVTVTGVDDAVTDGDIAYTILLKASSSDPTYNGLTTTTVSVTNIDNDTKFYVVNDASQDRAFEYTASGGLVESYGLNNGNTAPRGAATTIAGDKVWVVDANRKVYVYNTSGGLLGSWTAGSLPGNATVEDITVCGADVWIVDARSDKVFRYSGAATRLSGSQNATSSFSLNSGNTNPKGMVTDGTSLWVVDDGTTDKVFKYTVAGSLVGSWTIDSVNSKPTGLTIDPANVSNIWIVDSGTRLVYRYNAAASRTSGSQTAAATFALAAGNTNPQGIADPPSPASMLPTGRRSASLTDAALAAYVQYQHPSQPDDSKDKHSSAIPAIDLALLDLVG